MNAVDTNSPLAALLQNAGGDDPRTSMILNALQQAMQGNTADNELVTLRARVESLTRAAETMRERLTCLAAALGACPRCLGDNANCRTCDGDGIPGALRPDKQAFERYVLPAVRRQRTAANKIQQPVHANAQEPE
jgi:hypothetical protein